MKDPKELFQKVFIHSKADLPKEVTNYFTHNKQLDTKEDRWFAEHLSKYWLDNVDWYLLPYKEETSQSELAMEPKQTAEEWIEEKLGYDYLKSSCRKWSIGMIAISAIKEYANYCAQLKAK